MSFTAIMVFTVAGLSVMSTPARAAQPPADGIEVCDDLATAIKGDASLGLAVQDVKNAMRGKKASTASLLEALKTTGAMKRHPHLAISARISTPSSLDVAPAPETVAESPDAALGLCVRVAWGPGKVTWSWSNPQSSPYYWSYKPESSTSLKWASAPEDDTDAIYKRSWERCKALKIPDSGTVTVRSDSSFSICQNAAMAALGHVVKWVNTCSGSEGSFPDDGL